MVRAMLIRINHGHWLNFKLDDLCGITIAHAKIKGDKRARFTVNFEFVGYGETSDFFNSFDEAEKFALEIVNQLNSEASHAD